MKKSKKVSINIKRAVNELESANHWGIGNVIFNEIILVGINEYKEHLSTIDNDNMMLISKRVYNDVFDILEKHLV